MEVSIMGLVPSFTGGYLTHPGCVYFAAEAAAGGKASDSDTVMSESVTLMAFLHCDSREAARGIRCCRPFLMSTRRNWRIPPKASLV